MAQNTLPTGCVYLSCRASLESPQPLNGDDETVAFNALLFCVKPTDHTCVVAARLHYTKEEDDDCVLQQGIFDVFAIVVAYHSDEPLSVYQRERFKLMGDIIQLNAVPVEPEDAIAACRIPARLVGVGTVTSVDSLRHSFTISPTQYLTGTVDLHGMAVRAMLEKGPKWPDPVKRLPSTQSHVSFTGKLYQFEEYDDRHSSCVVTRAVINLDTITYLPRSSTSASPTLSTALPSQIEDADSLALKERVEKYARGSQSGVEAASPGKTKGKRKAA